MENFTLEDWLKVDSQPFSITEEQVEKLRVAAETFHNLAAELDIPYVLGYTVGSDSDTCNMVTCSQLVPLERTPGELLVAYVASVYGIDAVMSLIYSMSTEQ